MPAKPRATRHTDTGFTLLEVMIAFLIAALALGVLYQSGGSGVRSTAIAVHYEAALSRAQSRLAAAAAPSALRVAEASGDDGGGYAWHTQVSRIAAAPLAGSAPAAGKAAPQAVLYAVRVTISWQMDGGDRMVTLATARAGMAAPAAP